MSNEKVKEEGRRNEGQRIKKGQKDTNRYIPTYLIENVK